MRKDRRSPYGVATVVLVVALLVAVAGGVLELTRESAQVPSAAQAAEPIDGYPQRIGFERPSPTLPDRPGALAGTLYDNDFGNGRPLGVTADGRLWELRLSFYSLSPDGTTLLGAPFRGPVFLQDLTTGNKRELERVGQDRAASSQLSRYQYVLRHYTQVAWAPDESAVLGWFSRRPHRGRGIETALLDLDSQELTAVPGRLPAGFRSTTEVVTLRPDGDGFTALTTDLDSGRTRALPLQLSTPWRGDPDGQPKPSVSPDGSTLLLLEIPDGGGVPATARLFSLDDGREVDGRPVDDADSYCAISWLGDDPVVPTKRRGEAARAVLLTADDSRSLVAVHHRLQSSCLQLTPAALAAGPDRMLFGASTLLPTWYWWQLLGLLSVVLLVVTAALWNRSRNRY